MELGYLKDIEFEDIQNKQYDFGLFASGYEPRSIFIPKMVQPKVFSLKFVCGFTDKRETGARQKNDGFFRDEWNVEPVLVPSDDASLIISEMRKIKGTKDSLVSIFVDYSSMSRTWYSSVLNWVKFGFENKKGLEIDFAYTIGKYPGEYPHRVISQITAIPGCEGHLDNSNRTIAVFGLGFWRHCW